jgi:hypothetical protein
MPTEEEGRQARIQAERGLKETKDRWKDVHDVSAGLERVRRETGPDPFLDELARAMRPRPKHHREA